MPGAACTASAMTTAVPLISPWCKYSGRVAHAVVTIFMLLTYTRLLFRSAGSPEEHLIKRKYEQVRAFVDAAQASQLCTETALGDPDLVSEIIAFYRLTAAWLMRCVSPTGMPSLPLPETVPMTFATLPEWFVEDMAEFMLYVTRACPQVNITTVASAFCHCGLCCTSHAMSAKL